jgi:energy-coupling factor transport system ATP-binding protein
MTESNPAFLTTITGNNFSGRSNYLKTLLSNSEENNRTNIYIGEQPSNFITGIFPTVKSEINLHIVNTEWNTKNKIFDLFSAYNFEKHQSKNPFSLSGGEQSILVILSNLLLQPQKLAIDTTLEQLNEEWRSPLLTAIQNGNFHNSHLFLSDNRLKEYNLYNTANIFSPQQDITYDQKFEKPFVDYQLQTQIDEKKIELVDLSFSYVKNDFILNNVNVCLEPSNIYHLKGSNGAGKSTLAKILTGILKGVVKTKNGRLLVNDKEYNVYKYPGSLVGYSFQNPDEQLFSATVENEVLIPIKNEPVEYTRKREIFLGMFGLQNIRKCHPAELPFVMRKRIALAATLAMDRAWYILDEPTLGQDDFFVVFLVELLDYLIKQGKGIIIISHSESFVEKLNVKCLSLRDKKIN